MSTVAGGTGHSPGRLPSSLTSYVPSTWRREISLHYDVYGRERRRHASSTDIGPPVRLDLTSTAQRGSSRWKRPRVVSIERGKCCYVAFVERCSPCPVGPDANPVPSSGMLRPHATTAADKAMITNHLSMRVVAIVISSEPVREIPRASAKKFTPASSITPLRSEAVTRPRALVHLARRQTKGFFEPKIAKAVVESRGDASSAVTFGEGQSVRQWPVGFTTDAPRRSLVMTAASRRGTGRRTLSASCGHARDTECS